MTKIQNPAIRQTQTNTSETAKEIYHPSLGLWDNFLLKADAPRAASPPTADWPGQED